MPNRKIFVFGSNRAGRHGAGAAKHAVDHYGAVYGKGQGLQGQSYAIPTKDKQMHTLPLDEIRLGVMAFLDLARQRPDLEFYVTRIGCGLAGYRDEQIAPFFRTATENVRFDTRWLQYLPGHKDWGST